MTYKTYKNQFGHVQNLQKSIRTCAELTKVNSDMCRTYKIRFGHVQNLQNSIRTCAELTKINSDMCRTYKIGQNTPQNSDKCMRPVLSNVKIQCMLSGSDISFLDLSGKDDSKIVPNKT